MKDYGVLAPCPIEATTSPSGKGINPEIQFERTHTLVQDNDYWENCL